MICMLLLVCHGELYAMLTPIPSDLKELRKLLGVKRCPNCQMSGKRVTPYHDTGRHRAISLAEVHELVQEAREMRLTNEPARAARILNHAGLVAAHLHGVCPFLKIPHFSADAFVPERLHERSVFRLLCGALCVPCAAQCAVTCFVRCPAVRAALFMLLRVLRCVLSLGRGAHV